MQNPTRRSRRIGLTQGGRVKDGSPAEKPSRLFPRNLWEELSNSEGPLRVFVENPSRNYFHPCEPADYLALLGRLPADTTRSLRAIALRRTSRRDERAAVEARRRYSCILLNSFPRSLEATWHRRPLASEVRHFEPWCRLWLERDGVWLLKWSVAEVRQYYLYHVFLHELGHINQPWSHSLRRREVFAETFALEWARRLGALR